MKKSKYPPDLLGPAGGRYFKATATAAQGPDASARARSWAPIVTEPIRIVC